MCTREPLKKRPVRHEGQSHTRNGGVWQCAWCRGAGERSCCAYSEGIVDVPASEGTASAATAASGAGLLGTRAIGIIAMAA